MTKSAILYQNGEVLREFTPDEFEDGCVTVTSNPIYDDTEFTFRVTYTNKAELEESKTVTCSLPIFIGSLPKWKFANTITWDYLIELKNEKLGKFTNLSDTTYLFNFEDPQLRHPFIVVPYIYPDLESMTTKSQEFTEGAFSGLQASEEDMDIINIIPLQVPGAKSDIIYKIYVYRQALSNLHLKVTFNFKSEE